MLSRGNRIPRRLFSPILSSRSFKNSLHFTLRIGESSVNVPRIAVSVSKKVAKGAVERNTLRRRVYAVLKDEIRGLKAGLYLFVAKRGASGMKGEALKKEVLELLNSVQRA
ncbi:ribonuclease P protein component [Candidatus Parcubacteria bacterium]|nr:ribonuclease P protein component [Candidatus Parcubacteria bacterium]